MNQLIFVVGDAVAVYAHGKDESSEKKAVHKAAKGIDKLKKFDLTESISCTVSKEKKNYIFTCKTKTK